jgi:hypothetical protein
MPVARGFMPIAASIHLRRVATHERQRGGRKAFPRGFILASGWMLLRLWS